MHTHLARALGVPLRGEHLALLVPAQHVPHARLGLGQGLVDLHGCAAGVGEHAVDALALQRLDEDVRPLAGFVVAEARDSKVGDGPLRREVLHLRRGQLRLGEHGGIHAGLCSERERERERERESAIGRRGERERGGGGGGGLCFPLARPLVSGVCGSRLVCGKSFNPARTGARGGATRDSRGAHRDHGGIGHGGAGDVPLGSLRSGRGGEVSAGPGSRGNGRESRSAPGGRTTVEDRRAVGSRAVARAAAREGSDGSRRGEHDTGVPRVSPRSLRARAVVTSPEARAPSGAAKRFVGRREARERARG